MCKFCIKTIYTVRDVWNDCLMTVYFHNEKNTKKNKVFFKDDIENTDSQYGITLDFPFNNFNRNNLFKVIQIENKRCKEYDMGIRLELLR